MPKIDRMHMQRMTGIYIRLTDIVNIFWPSRHRVDFD